MARVISLILFAACVSGISTEAIARQHMALEMGAFMGQARSQQQSSEEQWWSVSMMDLDF